MKLLDKKIHELLGMAIREELSLARVLHAYNTFKQRGEEELFCDAIDNLMNNKLMLAVRDQKSNLN